MSSDHTDTMDRYAEAREAARQRREARRERRAKEQEELDDGDDSGVHIPPEDVPDLKAEREAEREPQEPRNITPTIDATIEVTRVTSGNFDLNGGRGSSEGTTTHLENTNPPTTGWLGNPYDMHRQTPEERRRVIAAYLRTFLDRVARDDEFAAAVDDLRGQRVACWCRGVSQDRDPSNWCHLDVVAHYLDGDLRPVFAYLRGDE